MHGRKKPSEAPSSEELTLAAKKVLKYKALSAECLQHRKDKNHSKEALVTNAKLLAANPDFYSMWNYRRDVLLEEVFGKLEGEPLAAMVKGELDLTVAALQRNPKSYGAWFQRQWLVEQADCPLDKELALCSKFLEADERNFHCWHYRRWLAAKSGVDLTDELAFITKKINLNFSNYSAWHYRTHLLPALGLTSLDTYSKELDLVQSAMYTEPYDQTVWMYHRWVLKAVVAVKNDPEAASDGRRDRAVALLDQEIERCEELWDCEEERCKWPLIAIAFIKQALGYPGVADLYKTLAELDPHHKRYYEARTAAVATAAAATA